MADFDIPGVVSDLEGAGILGGAAIALLVPFLGGPPGSAVSTGTGFVWTKSILSGAEGTSVSLGGLGRLKLDSGAISVTLAANWYGPLPSVDILFQLNDGQALSLALNEDLVQSASRVSLPGEAGAIIGYDRSTLGQVTIPLPAVALEFSFRPGLGDGIAAAIQTYLPGGGGTAGIFEWSPAPDKLLILRKLFDIGLGLDRLFIDLSATNGVADFRTRFADVYTASWKGIGAQQIDIVVPVEDTFINASATGFLVDFDGAFTGDFTLAWRRPAGPRLTAIDAEISLRENVPLRGEIGVTIDLDGVKQVADQPAAGASTASGSAAETERAERAKTEFALRKDNLDLGGQVRFSGALTYAVLGGGAEPERTVYAIDLTGAAVTNAQGGTIHAFTGTGAVAVLWTVTALIGVPLFIRGIQQEDASDALTALGMVFLAIVVGDEVGGTGPVFLPRLETINLNALKLRYVHISVEETLPDQTVSRYSQRLVELGLDMGAVFAMDCRVTDLIDKLLAVSIQVGSNLVGLFGSVLETAELKGNLELQFGNLFLRFAHTEAHQGASGPVAAGFEIFPVLDPGLARLLEERSPVITARQIPELRLVPAEGGSAIPRPVTEVKAVRTGEGATLRRGVSVAVSGLGNASMAVATPAAGVVVFWSPDFAVEPLAQLQKDPEFSFLMPPVAYARGVIDLGKPLPSIGGQQSRIAVDVGIRNTKVKAGKDLSADDQKKLRDFKNYEWAFGGEIVWGDATGGPLAEEFSFLFVEVHYEGKTPLFTLGPIGFYGLGGLFGHNIAPGRPPEQQNALGIADWIFGDGKGAFTSVRDWPSGEPTPATWHPDRDFVRDKDRWALGLFVKAGSAGDGGKSVSVDTIVMLGFPEFWLAIAGFAVIKPISAELTVVIVYDHPSRSFVIKVAFNYKVDKESGRIVDMKQRLEIGSIKEPKRRWFYLGHYANEQGGPGGAELFKLVNVKFYVVYDTQGTDKFGIVLIDDPKTKPPAIPGPLFGIGALWQFGPKKYGPSWLNISLFAGLGFNVAVGSNPFLIYGDLYAVGHVQVKIAVFKGKLGISARLYGLASEDFYRFAGEIEIRINLPWPLSDIHKSFDFIIEGGVPAFPPPVLSTTSSALGRTEPRAIALTPDQIALVPVDSVIAIAFNKPIFEVQAVTPGNSMLTINDPQLPDAAPDPVEKLTTEFADRTYEITLKHVIRYVRIERRPVPQIANPPDTGWTLVAEMAAAWDPPDDIAADGAPEPGSEPHHVLYLNAFVAPELQFSQSALEKHYGWTEGWHTVPPCLIGDRLCLLGDDIALPPVVDQSGSRWMLDFATGHGPVRIAELRVAEASYGGLPRNLQRLAWVGGQLDLAEATGVRLPDADEVDLVLRFGAQRPANPPILQRMSAVVAVRLRGLGAVTRVRVVARVDAGSPCSFALETEPLQEDTGRLSMTVKVERCDSGIHELAVRIGLVASDYLHLIEEVTIDGAFLDWDQDEIANRPPGQLVEIFARLQETLLFRAEQLCFRRSRTSRSHWPDSLLATDADGGVGPGALLDNLLLAPDSEYRVRYGLASFASSRVQNDDPDAPNETDDQPAAVSDSSEVADALLPTLRFRTEAAPSQDPGRYVGLTYPAARDGSAAPYYAGQMRPFLTLKSSGLLARIYRQHYGAEMLRSEIVDIDGAPLLPDLVASVDFGSSPLDQSLEDLLSQCLPAGAEVSWSRLEVWQAALAPAQDYALQITDLRPGATRPLWSRAFRTSAFHTFAAHVAHAVDVLSRAEVVPVVDGAAAGQTLASLLSAVQSTAAPGRDALVEAIYRDLLGVDGGSLRRHLGAPDVDLAAELVGRDASGERVWAVALELDEPLVGRADVVPVNYDPGAPLSLPGQGLWVVAGTGSRLLLVSDTAGTRVLILGLDASGGIVPLAGDLALALRYRPGDEVARLARLHLEGASRPLAPAEFEARFAALMAAIAGQPGLAVNLATYEATLAVSLPLPPSEPPDPGSGGGGSGDPPPAEPPSRDDPPPDPGPAPGPRPGPRRPPRSGRSAAGVLRAGRNALMLMTGLALLTAFAAAGAARKAAKKRRRKHHKKRQGHKE